jgi:guanylate kinase
VVANDRIEDAVEKLKSIIITERCRKVKGLILKENKRQWEEKDG